MKFFVPIFLINPNLDIKNKNAIFCNIECILMNWKMVLQKNGITMVL